MDALMRIYFTGEKCEDRKKPAIVIIIMEGKGKGKVADKT
jgi:hypothetical protein